MNPIAKIVFEMNPNGGVAQALAPAITVTIRTHHRALRATAFDIEVSFLWTESLGYASAPRKSFKNPQGTFKYR
jgi:hypothetical protein